MYYEKEDEVSIWVADFESSSGFDEYIKQVYDDDGDASSPFMTDFMIGWYDDEFQEAYFHPHGPLPIGELIGYFSYSSSFIDEVVRAAADQKETANAVILIYGFKYDGVLSAEKDGNKIYFLGSFHYDKGVRPVRETLNGLIPPNK